MRASWATEGGAGKWEQMIFYTTLKRDCILIMPEAIKKESHDNVMSWLNLPPLSRRHKTLRTKNDRWL